MKGVKTWWPTEMFLRLNDTVFSCLWGHLCFVIVEPRRSVEVMNDESEK